MAATHKLQITFDEAAGRVTAVHRCTVEVAGQRVSHAREIELEGDPAAALKGILDANRAAMEQDATALAVDHVAAVAKKAPKGVKQLKVGGTLGPAGGTAVEKK
jgi:hypothetical protein